MKIVYFGTSDFAVPALEKLAKDVVLVITQPDRPSGRGMKLKASPVKLKAIELGLPVETPEKARDPEFVQKIQELEADVHVVAAYGQILSTKLLETATRGGINLHGSILPDYRGAAPIQRAIMDGKTETGVTLMQMDKGMDTGDIIDIVRTPIDPNETYGELHARLAQLAATQIEEWIERIAHGNYPRQVQDHDTATYASKITAEERELRFDAPATVEYNRLRGLSPSPGAFFQTDLGRIKIIESRPSNQDGIGVFEHEGHCHLGFQVGSLVLKQVQPEGRKPMSGSDWLRGAVSGVIAIVKPS
ncbi:MAG: methionyl-tRNA formyltransferase [Armatimonadetes bacterium Cent15-Ar3]|nr:MAG: methionyl-tRNA formyltransferase [Armatimonadetes bacterium Cent15-Ar3]